MYISSKPDHRYTGLTTRLKSAESSNKFNRRCRNLVAPFLFTAILLPSCEEPSLASMTTDTEIEVVYRVMGGIVMEDVVMRVTAPNKTITRVVIEQNQEVIEDFDGCDKSVCEFDVSDTEEGTYLVTVYSGTSILFTEEVTID